MGCQPYLRGSVCAYHHPPPPAAFSHNIYAWFNWNLNCDEKRTKINRKRREILPIKIACLNSKISYCLTFSGSADLWSISERKINWRVFLSKVHFYSKSPSKLWPTSWKSLNLKLSEEPLTRGRSILVKVAAGEGISSSDEELWHIL